VGRRLARRHCPRLPNGPTQGKGLDVLLVVGTPNPATTRNATTIPGSSLGAQSAEKIAAANAALARGYAYVIFNHNDCGEDSTLRERDGSWSFRPHAILSGLPQLRLGTAPLLGLGRVAHRRLPADGPDD
jgi:hypothetical protein